MLGRRQAGRNWPLREGLEVCDARVAPPRRLLLLDAQERCDLLATFRIHQRSDFIPGLAHLTHDIYAVRVAIHELVPERAARMHPIAPGNMMEPQQIIFRDAPQVAEFCSDGCGVLRDGVAATRTAIETDALRVRAMKVHGRPVGTPAAIEPRLRAVVMTLS